MSSTPTPAAEYLRMSTEHQRYSLDNQAQSIGLYAAEHGFQVVRSYVDRGKSGLLLKRREGLSQLLKEVVNGSPCYRAILVYDVSRWGRFQDTDEAAYYEFMCKRAGIAVHYCAETFTNDSTTPNLVMKTLKRVMAAEYSRDLSSKVYAGSRRNAEAGFRCGGTAGYGLRRLICSPDGTLKLTLQPGERKNVYSDRIKLIPGPPEEVAIVRKIFSMVIYEKKTLWGIANELNRDGIPYLKSRWTNNSVQEVIKNPKYMGCHVWGRSAKKLGGPTVQLPEASWVRIPNLIEPLVDEKTFLAAGSRLRHVKTDDELLSQLRELLKNKGWASRSLIDTSPEIGAASTFVDRFGGLKQAYARVGYVRPRCHWRVEIIRRNRAVRLLVESEILASIPGTAILRRANSQRWPRLRLPGGRVIRLFVCQQTKSCAGHARWILPTHERPQGITLLCRCTEDNSAIMDYQLVPRIKPGTRWLLSDSHPLLLTGHPVRNLRDLPRLVGKLHAA